MLVAADLFFVARIAEAARAAGVTLIEVDSGAALEACRAAPPDLLVLDLHGPGDPPALARALKSDDATRAIPIVGYYSHIDRERGERARAAGIEQVMPRSAFTLRLPSLLTGEGR